MTTKHKVSRTNFDKNQAIETFEKYKETGNGKIIRTKENQTGYTDAYAEGWTRIFGKKEEVEETEEIEEITDFVTFPQTVTVKEYNPSMEDKFSIINRSERRNNVVDSLGEKIDEAYIEIVGSEEELEEVDFVNGEEIEEK